MRPILFVFALMVGCSAAPTYVWDDSVIDETETNLEQRPPPPGGSKRPTRKNDHPQGNVNVESGPGTLEYRTRGTGNNANTEADGTFWRFTYNQRYVGVQLSGFDTRSELRGTTSADSFDGFVYANLPLWPNRRLRFVSRPGAYYNDINLKNAVVGDVEPRTWGFRYELEGEFDIIKKPRLILSVYAAGRFEWGYGDAKTGTGGEEHVDGYGWGWETGVRLQWRRLFGGVAYVYREQEFDGSRFFLTADYVWEGATAFIGFRW